MNRRHLVALLCGAAVARPDVVHPAERMRRIGALMSGGSETDQQASLAVFKEILHQLGLIDGRNVRVMSDGLAVPPWRLAKTPKNW